MEYVPHVRHLGCGVSYVIDCYVHVSMYELQGICETVNRTLKMNVKKVRYFTVLSIAKVVSYWCLEHWLNDTASGKLKYKRKTCHIITTFSTSHVHWPGIEPRPQK